MSIRQQRQRKSLIYALEEDIKDIGCASVIHRHSSPKQKALVTRLVEVKIGSTTLAIGDGANNVGILQEANIGVDISGVEGTRFSRMSWPSRLQRRRIQILKLLRKELL